MYLPSPRRTHRLPLILALLLLALIAWTTLSQPKRRYAPLGAYFNYAEASVPVSAVTPLPAASAIIIQQAPAAGTTSQIDLVLETELYAAESAALAEELQIALSYVEERTAITLADRVRVVITQDAGCGFHGITYSDIRTIIIYSCAGIPRQRVVNIAAHEYVHQLAQDRYGPPHLSADLALSEGLATWGAGRYWLGGNPDFAAFARQYDAEGVAIPLGTHYSAVGLGGMNILYYEWASFVEYLLATYGRERFDALYVSGGGGRPGNAQYAAIYGRSFDTLAAEWQAWFRGATGRSAPLLEGVGDAASVWPQSD